MVRSSPWAPEKRSVWLTRGGICHANIFGLPHHATCLTPTKSNKKASSLHKRLGDVAEQSLSFDEAGLELVFDEPAGLLVSEDDNINF
jgi:hypothetical protein